MEKNRKDESYSDYLVRHKGDKQLTGVEKSDLEDTIAYRKKIGKKKANGKTAELKTAKRKAVARKK